MEILGYITAILIGISLGLIGGGGSILTVPALVYLMGMPALLSTTYSLFVVGITSFAGAFTYIKKGLVNYMAAIIFALPSFAAVVFSRVILLPLIPETVSLSNNYLLSKDSFLILLFSVIMILASYFMIKGSSYAAKSDKDINSFNNRIKIGFMGLIVGIVSGLVGAGGGFIIIPALVIFGGLKMKQAVGTSLLIIAFNSIIGFSSGLQNQELNWTFLFTFTTLSIAGIFIGSYLTNFIEGEKLKKGFGFFILIMGIIILIKEML